MRVLGVLLLAVVFITLFFYVRAPSAARVYATTGALSYVTPKEREISGRISWPVRQGLLCLERGSRDFVLDAENTDWDCIDGGNALTGSIWFSPAVEVLIRSADDGVDIFFTPQNESEETTLNFRRRDGTLTPISGRAKLSLDAAQPSFVLPVISQAVWVGQATEWQSLEAHPVLQHGSISLIRESVFGDILFSSERFELALGDFVELKGREPDYIQGLLQVTPGEFFDVALTVSKGDAWLHRLSRDPIRLDAPLAAHFFRDPALVIIGTIFTVIAGLIIGLLQIRPSRVS